MTAVITSFSALGWEEYGRRFVETFDQFWPKHVDLHLVSEDHITFSDLPDRRVCAWDLNNYEMAKGFLDRFKNQPWARGLPGIPPHDIVVNRKRPPQKCGGAQAYNFRYDAHKFCKKVFAIDLVAHAIDCRRLFWIDADVVTHEYVDDALLQQVLPDNVVLSCLERRGYHSECGFIGYNLPEALGFIRQFSLMYVDDLVFSLTEWHDSWVFDWLRGDMEIPVYAIPHNSISHPFINSVLGKYMDHLKGNRKKQGRSSPSEQTVNREVKYWRR